jgi:hypothetical protein
MAISDVLSLLGPFINSPLLTSTSMTKEGAVNMQQIQQIAQSIFSQGKSANGQGGIPGISELFGAGQNISALTRNSANILEIINSALGGANQAGKTATFDKDPIKKPPPTETFDKLEKDDKTDPPYYIPKKNSDGTTSV